MASLVETLPSHHQLSFTRHSASTSLATLPQAPVQNHDTDVARKERDSATSTPTHKRHMSFGVSSSFGTPTGGHQLQRSYDGNGSMMQQYPPRQPTSIYTVCHPLAPVEILLSAR